MTQHDATVLRCSGLCAVVLLVVLTAALQAPTVSHMRRGVEERGPIAAWLITSRGQFREPGAARAWTVDTFLETLQEETGWAPARTTYARWESGAARPEPENLERVVRFYAARGIPGPGALPEPASEQADLIAAIKAQTAAMVALVEELKLSRQAQVSATDVAFQALGALGRSPDPRETRLDTEPEAHAGTGR